MAETRTEYRILAAFIGTSRVLAGRQQSHAMVIKSCRSNRTVLTQHQLFYSKPPSLMKSALKHKHQVAMMFWSRHDTQVLAT